MSDITRETLTSWDKIKKLVVRDINGDEDTIDWVYRNECKVIEKFIKDNLPQETKVEVHPNQLTIDDL